MGIREAKLCISALGPTITQQLAAQGFGTIQPFEAIDRMEHAIHLLRIRGLLTHTESDRAFKRLLKDIESRASHGGG